MAPEAPNREQLKTYDQWIRVGRCVRAGERAEWYLTNEARDRRVAVFHEDQTDELREARVAGFNEILSAEEWHAIQAAARVPRIRVRPWKEDGLACWVGANADAIKILKKAGWRFSREENRWTQRNRDLVRFTTAMEEAGFSVIIDG